MKKILILIDQFHSHGGIEKLVSVKANFWTENFGYDVKIISTEQENKPFVYELSDKVKFQDLSINYERGISFFHPKNLKKLTKNFFKIQKLVNTEQPDFILVASHIPMTYLLPLIKTNAKIIKEFHFSKYNQTKNFKENLFNSVEKYYDFLAVLSNEEASFYKTKNVVVIPNPIEISKNFVIKKISERENIAAAVLRFAPVKQLEKMVNIWEQFSAKNPDWKLYFYGTKEGDYFEKVQQLIQDKNLENSIIFKGKTDDVFTELNNSKLLLMTSENECFPMVILEANSCGVPVVSFDSPTGPRNIINHDKDGILVEYNNEEKFVEILENLIKNEVRLQELSDAAIENSKKYELQKVMNLWKNLIFDKS